MPSFDRFDICEAYYALEIGWNRDGLVRERKHNPGIGAQLSRIQFSAACSFRGFESLSDNGKEIYAALCERLGLEDPDVAAWRANGYE